MDVFIFEAGQTYFGIKAKYIYRIADGIKVVPVPLLPEAYAGLIYYRGDLFDVIDMGVLMGKSASFLRDDPYILLVRWNGGRLGLIPGRIIGMKSMEETGERQVPFSEGKKMAKLIDPHEIWQALSGLSYGA